MISPLVWLIAGLALMGFEILAPSFVLFWFGAGALITSGLVALGVLDTWLAQWLVFLLSSMALLLLWQVWLKKFFHRKVVDEKRDPTVSGQVGTVTKAIGGVGSPGEVELTAFLYGIKVWVAEADVPIPVGAKVRVLEASGVRLLVQRIDTEIV
jgi:membrane protein implicated in regulation of membrane protease activity